jgi:hypothetical protein
MLTGSDILFTTPTNETQANASATLVNTLVANNQMQYFDAIYLFATVNTNNPAQSRSVDSLKNYISSSYTGTEILTPNWLSGYGYYGDGSSNVAISLLNPTAGGLKFTQNDCHISVYSRDNLAQGIELGQYDGAKGAWISTKYSDGNAYLNLNAAASVNFGAMADSRGWFYGERSGAANISLYKNNVLVATSASVSAGIANQPFYALAMNSSGSVFGTSQLSKKMAICSIGKSGMNRAIVYAAFNQYLTDIGYPL